MCAWGNFGCDFVEMELHGLGVASGEHESSAGSALGAYRAEQIGRHIVRSIDAERARRIERARMFLGRFGVVEIIHANPRLKVRVVETAIKGAAMLSSSGPCFGTLFVGDTVDHLDYGGDVMVRKAILDAALVEAGGHVEQRCSGSR